MERRNTVMTLVVAFLLAMTFVQIVSAEVVNPQTLTASNSERRDLSTIGAKTANAVAGNVTQLDISALFVTTSWQGYYGNVSGEITLDDAQNNTFYNWSITTASGEIYASRAASPTWATIGCADAGEITSEETYLGQLAGDGDSVSNTFLNTATHPAFNVSTVQITADDCYATNAFINTGQSATDFYQVLLADGGSNIVYSTLIDDDQTGFDGSTWDFEMLVGENGKANTAVTPYYFFVELQ